MSITPTKLTLAQAIARQEVAKNNSDLENLASALMSIKQQRQELDDLEAEINSMAAIIEGGSIVPVEEIAKLYRRACADGKTL